MTPIEGKDGAIAEIMNLAPRSHWTSVATVTEVLEYIRFPVRLTGSPALVSDHCASTTYPMRRSSRMKY